MQEIRTVLAKVLEQVTKYSRRSDSVSRMINLLALNARIESARLGAVGGAFNAVAEEIKAIADTARSQAAEFSRSVSSEISDALHQVDGLLTDFESARLLGVVKAVADAVSKYLFERSVDLQMLAADPAIIDAFVANDPPAHAHALARLRRLMQVCPFYLNAFIADRSGRVIVSADEHSHVLRINLSDAGQFTYLINNTSGQWNAGEVWQNPDAGGTIMLVYAAAVCAPGDPSPVGILYLEFDWSNQINRLLKIYQEFTKLDDTSCTIAIVDGSERIVASTEPDAFGTSCRIGDIVAEEVHRTDGSVRIIVRPTGQIQPGGRDLSYVIEQVERAPA